MEEKELNSELKEEKVLLDEYKRLQENTVSKEKYEKDIAELKEKNQIYLDAITNGKSVDIDTREDSSLEDQIKDLSKFKGTNLEYWAKMTSAVDKMLKTTPEAEITRVTGTDGLEELIRVNEGMKQMVQDADGDPDYFRTIYKQRVKDSSPQISAEIEKAGGVYNYLSKQQNKK